MAGRMSRTQWVKLVRILGMLGSDHDGERASAALAAHRRVKAAKLDWAELLAPLRPPATTRRRPNGPFVDAFHDPAAAARSRISQLSQDVARLEAEVKRLRRMLLERRERPLSPATTRSLGRDGITEP